MSGLPVRRDDRRAMNGGSFDNVPEAGPSHLAAGHFREPHLPRETDDIPQRDGLEMAGVPAVRAVVAEDEDRAARHHPLNRGARFVIGPPHPPCPPVVLSLIVGMVEYIDRKSVV